MCYNHTCKSLMLPPLSVLLEANIHYHHLSFALQSFLESQIKLDCLYLYAYSRFRGIDFQFVEETSSSRNNDVFGLVVAEEEEEVVLVLVMLLLVLMVLLRLWDMVYDDF